MAIVDERGRLFGRWNLLDFALAVLILGLIPLGYAAYSLFRERPPKLVSISPAVIEQVPEFRLTIKGENLRPYMRVSVGPQQGRDFIFKSIEEAEIPFAGMAPGKYDVILFDQAQERFRLPNALTISPSSLPSTEVVAIGAFGNLDAAAAAKLTTGMELPGVGKILAVGKPMPDLTQVFSGSKLIAVPIPNALRLPAIVKFNCYIRAQQGSPYCVSDDVTLTPTALTLLPTPLGKTAFQVQRVRSSAPLEPVAMSMRLRGSVTVLGKVKAGDVDTGGINNEFAALSHIDSVGSVRSTGEGIGELDIKMTAQAQRADGGWLYDSLPLRAGSQLTLKTSTYEVTGLVTDVAKQP